ncbi:WSC domain-containing protein [Lachnellula hyalina]|uniref:WSC domain-containing protein n=1 Tax=Lachnellula hyalina TaxID=1316788 RepID=A0A8H8U2B6_9HELO|nr:WSC domain-containing protein [Lachnellula hyalina]TVY28792.1 WSC domain-containing protein [Lachnellula hyalina]
MQLPPRIALVELLLAAAAVVTSACNIPTTSLSSNITGGFGILIQNPAYPVIHDRYMNLAVAGGGDKHLFLSPVGDYAFDLDLNTGFLEQDIIHAVIDGEYSEIDNTTKMFMTERGDPKAIFTPVYGCNPDNVTETQIQLAFATREESPVGGSICVRVASGNRGYEFRYSPPENPVLLSTPPSNLPSPTSTSTTSLPTATPTAPPTIPPTWTFLGCQTEATSTRALSSNTYANDSMTLESCADFCAGYTYFGTEYARECYCGDVFEEGSVEAAAVDCSFACAGDAGELCGAGNRLSVYSSS